MIKDAEGKDATQGGYVPLPNYWEYGVRRTPYLLVFCYWELSCSAIKIHTSGYQGQPVILLPIHTPHHQSGYSPMLHTYS